MLLEESFKAVSLVLTKHEDRIPVALLESVEVVNTLDYTNSLGF